ncbi:hydroxymethylbilane synthase [Roseospira marina]|uniref:Porphobilinogen deaminase n=1 Tax=Roseospira marina TaxID=140057 RepID=A0A5M6IHD5_9PROT|nr:hydroxymethylbilane synthase [Roseospira marina]KAA5606968.1 hydroxymethylbilane synthase [Roseospira marina]MBB4312854.1 hydroxymethylbilane synthase [Roseospira marina]MBB5086373.1 hydroxymethylbilane synthase [Roseospira marina]
MSTTPLLKIGTRGSPLALAQAHAARDALAAAHPELAVDGAMSIEIIKTTGDSVQDRPLSEIGGKGLFTREIDDAQTSGAIDIAVHSMKDVPTVLEDGLVLPCIMPREDVRDAFISVKYKSFAELPEGAVIGSASLRRASQILGRYPHLKVINFRGNLQTRLRKLNEGVADATMLAMAGLNRMGMSEVATQPMAPDEMLPAVAQGAVGITCRADDDRARAWIEALDCRDSHLRVAAERAFLAGLDGSCRTPIAGLAEWTAPGMMRLRGLIVRPDGRNPLDTERSGPVADRAAAEAMGADAAAELVERAGDALPAYRGEVVHGGGL